MKQRFWGIGLWMVVLAVCTSAWAVEIGSGLIVCIGGKSLERVSADWKNEGCVFQGLVTTDAEVDRLRKMIQKAGCGGKVTVSRFDGAKLPYINNLVNFLFVESGSSVSASELQRVLAPYGSVIMDGKKRTKPYPDAMDEWPQNLHGADNNCVAQDTVVGPPRHVQWISGPAWTRAHIGAATIGSMVTSGGRLFTIEDRATAENPLLPAQWKLVVRGAFNGVELWSKPYPQWEQITVYIKDFHAQMQRRLVADGEIVYCTPGLKAPLTALNAANGETIREYPGTEHTQEFVLHDGVLYTMIGDRMDFFYYKGAPGAAKKKKKKGDKKGKKAESTPELNAAIDPSGTTFGGAGFPLSAYNPATRNAKTPVSQIVAFNAKTGKELWRSASLERYVGCTMGLKADKLVYQTAQGLFCLNAKTGKENWAVKKKIPSGGGSNPNTVVLSDDAVYAEEGTIIRAYALTDGSDYWGKSVKARKGYEASTDLLIANGSLWMGGACNSGKGIVTVQPTSFDLKTGNEIKTIDQHLSKPMGHDRCYRNFITERFFINSKTGGPDCMDLKSDVEYPTSFTRGTCSMGPLPANGLIYCGPWACQCHLPTGLHNFNAFYTNEDALKTKGQLIKLERNVRLEKGPAYGYVGKGGDAPWATYRHDERRYSGGTEALPAKGLKPIWKTTLKSKGSAPTLAEGKLFVAETETHVLRALDATTGKMLWEYLAGGRIDSPPTYHKGLLLFGSRDGWMHCVRAADGALSWRFRDLPDQLICAFDQLESAWPINGSVLMKNDTAYFCAGRSSFLDGGLFIYGLDPATGSIRHERSFYGPYADDRFPAFVEGGSRSENEIILGTTADVMSAENDILYVRRQAFNLDLTDAKPGKHLLASAGMLEPNRQHREYKLVQEDFNHRKYWTTEKEKYPTGDIIVSDGTDYYSIFGVPVNRGVPFNPRNGYLLNGKTRSGDKWSDKWKVQIPITGKGMILAGDAILVVGAPLVFDPLDLGGTYAGRRGGVLWLAATADGSKLADYKLDVLPVWDGMASAYGRIFLVNQDGSVDCWGTK